MDQTGEITDTDFLQACNRFGECFENNIKKYNYIPFKSLYQQGPTCGLTALGMYCGMTSKDEVERLILEEATNLGFTKRGEMFSTTNMSTLTRKLVDKKVELFNGYLACEKITDFLLDGGVMLVPYDADANHEPCIRNGYKAHWALISGVVISNSGAVYVLARQGKSRLLGLWSLSLLAASNLQLNMISPDRTSPDEYILPEGGLAGENGLCGKSVLIYHT